MAKKNVTIEDAKKNKIQLEKDILELVKKFEEDNGIYINYVSLERKYDDDDMKVVAERPSRRVGNLINVEASMELDLMY
jgi:hypothetical protein